MDISISDKYIFFTDIINLPTLIIYDTTYPCIKEHKLKQVEAITFCNKSTDLVKIEVQYCPNCKAYFIQKDVFDRYQSFYNSEM